MNIAESKVLQMSVPCRAKRSVKNQDPTEAFWTRHGADLRANWHTDGSPLAALLCTLTQPIHRRNAEFVDTSTSRNANPKNHSSARPAATQKMLLPMRQKTTSQKV